MRRREAREHLLEPVKALSSKRRRNPLSSV
jgi:hypothetical protein